MTISKKSIFFSLNYYIFSLNNKKIDYYLKSFNIFNNLDKNIYKLFKYKYYKKIYILYILKKIYIKLYKKYTIKLKKKVTRKNICNRLICLKNFILLNKLVKNFNNKILYINNNKHIFWFLLKKLYKIKSKLSLNNYNKKYKYIFKKLFKKNNIKQTKKYNKLLIKFNKNYNHILELEHINFNDIYFFFQLYLKKRKKDKNLKKNYISSNIFDCIKNLKDINFFLVIENKKFINLEKILIYIKCNLIYKINSFIIFLSKNKKIYNYETKLKYLKNLKKKKENIVNILHKNNFNNFNLNYIYNEDKELYFFLLSIKKKVEYDYDFFFIDNKKNYNMQCNLYNFAYNPVNNLTFFEYEEVHGLNINYRHDAYYSNAFINNKLHLKNLGYKNYNIIFINKLKCINNLHILQKPKIKNLTKKYKIYFLLLKLRIFYNVFVYNKKYIQNYKRVTVLKLFKKAYTLSLNDKYGNLNDVIKELNNNNSLITKKVINILMKKGKKEIVKKKIEKTFFLLRTIFGISNPRKALELAIAKNRIIVKLKKHKKGGIDYQVPYPVYSFKHQIFLTYKLFFNALRDYNLKNFMKEFPKLFAWEIFLSLINSPNSLFLKKIKEYHRSVSSNRSYIRFLKSFR